MKKNGSWTFFYFKTATTFIFGLKMADSPKFSTYIFCKIYMRGIR